MHLFHFKVNRFAFCSIIGKGGYLFALSILLTRVRRSEEVYRTQFIENRPNNLNKWPFISISNIYTWASRSDDLFHCQEQFIMQNWMQGLAKKSKTYSHKTPTCLDVPLRNFHYGKRTQPASLHAREVTNTFNSLEV